MNDILYHGSNHIIECPNFNLGKENNDYGRGFYCTNLIEMAKEWACKNNNDGYVNKYILDYSNLNILNLLDGNYTVLNWIAILLKNRVFSSQNEISIDSKDYIINNFLPNFENIDIIIGYRADDSYFSYAEAFISNSLSLNNLSKALTLRTLGTQIALISKKVFSQIKFINAESVRKEIYYSKFFNRDTNARETYKNEIRKSKKYSDEIFVLDILREEIKNNDARIPRIISR